MASICTARQVANMPQGPIYCVAKNKGCDKQDKILTQSEKLCNHNTSPFYPITTLRTKGGGSEPATQSRRMNNLVLCNHRQ